MKATFKIFSVFGIVAIMAVAAFNLVLSSERSIDVMKYSNIVVLADTESGLLSGCWQAEPEDVITDEKYHANPGAYTNYQLLKYCGNCKERYLLKTIPFICP